jgi:hypothetical protein
MILSLKMPFPRGNENQGQEFFGSVQNSRLVKIMDIRIFS